MKAMFFVIAAVVAALSIAFISTSKRAPGPPSVTAPSAANKGSQRKPRTLPPLVSKTRESGVYIESADADETRGQLIVIVRNDMDKDVSSFTVEGGKELQGTHGGTLPGQGPAIAAYSTAQIFFPLESTSLLRRPVVLTAVIFADGTEAGDEDARAATKRERRKVDEAHARDGISGGEGRGRQ